MVLQKYKLSTYGATKRLAGIEENLVEPILFLEKLYVFDENGKRIGRFTINIDLEDEETDGHKILYVHICNRAFINGKLSESLVTGTLTTKLKTLEEVRYECTTISETEKHERTVFMLRETTKYYVSVTNTFCNRKTRNHCTIPFVEALGLIGESANAVLIRKLATKGYEGILCLRTLLSNGKRYRNYYVSKLSQQVINGKKMEVLIIYRNITNHRKCNITMTLGLTRAGQLLYMFWSNSKCFLHIDPDAKLESNCFLFPRAELYRQWHKDIQLHSLYLDRVDEQVMMLRSYRYQHEQLKRLLNDFVEHLVFLKPKNVICFAIQFFNAFDRNPLQKSPSKSKLRPRFSENAEDDSAAQSKKKNDQDFFWMGE